jgi:DNA polymerase III epsilon subunit-like protein
MNDLLRFKFDQKFLLFDTETSNLAIVSEKPWQIGWLTAKGKYVTGKFERKILWKDYAVKPEIAVFNHFDEQQYLREARDPAEVLDEFESYLYDPSYISVGMNTLGFDFAIINNWRKALGRKTDYSWLDRHWDILAVFRAIQSGAKNPPKDDFLAWQYSWINHRDRKIKASLASQLKHYNIPFIDEARHSALVDVELTFEVFKKQLFELDI